MRSLRILTVLSLGVFSSAVVPQVAAQTSVNQIVPASPTSADVITAHISSTALCDVEVSTAVSGFTVRTDLVLSGCFGGPPGFNIVYDAPFGPLAAGTYTYQVYLDRVDDGVLPELVAQQTIVVAAAPAGAAIPTLGPIELSFLAAALILAALFSMRRFT